MNETQIEIFDNPALSSKEAEDYKKTIRTLLTRLLPQDRFFLATSEGAKLTCLKEAQPILLWSELALAPCNLSISFLCQHRLNAGFFFYDMLHRWLIPQKRINIDLFFAADFVFTDLSPIPYTVGEIIIRLKTEQEVEEVKRSMKGMDTELRLGLVSTYHANRILEFKGLPPDGKVAMIQEKIGSLIQSRSKDFDKSIFTQMQKFLVTCVDEFKSTRDYHHISRIISLFYLMRKLLKQKMEAFPHERHQILKFLKTKLSGEKPVLGILVGLNLLKDNEVFEKNHLMNAILHSISHVQAVENSLILDRNKENNIQTLYLEIEKKDGADFFYEEIQKLKTSLPDRLHTHIEYMMHPIFMPRNEEEILRNIMALARQLKYVQDLPQVIISFDEQQGEGLIFTAIILRILKPKGEKLEDVLKKSKASIQVDRIRKVGLLRRYYAKEAAVLRMQVPIKNYFRSDHSVDLYKARKDVFAKLEEIFGQLRDYNGGMIYHQNQHFLAFKESLGISAETQELLIQKFFFSLTPDHMRSVVDVQVLKTLFTLLLQTKKKDDWIFKEEEKHLFTIIPFQDSFLKKRIALAIEKLQIPSRELLSFSVDNHEYAAFGYLFLTDDQERKRLFIQTLQQVL